MNDVHLDEAINRVPGDMEKRNAARPYFWRFFAVSALLLVAVMAIVVWIDVRNQLWGQMPVGPAKLSSHRLAAFAFEIAQDNGNPVFCRASDSVLDREAATTSARVPHRGSRAWVCPPPAVPSFVFGPSWFLPSSPCGKRHR